MAEKAFSGKCSACGRDLVQIIGESYTKTYHPAASYDEKIGGRCPALLRMKGTENFPEPVYTLDVPDDVFVLDKY